MKSYYILFTLALCQVSSLFAEIDNYIVYEDYARFDVDSKPEVFGGKMEIREDADGSHYGHCAAGGTGLIADLGMLDPGGSDYTMRIKYRFPDPKQIGGPMLYFIVNGARKDVKYSDYQMRIDSNAIHLWPNGVQNATNKPPVIEPFKSETPMASGRWLELVVRVEPERLRVSGDLFGKEEVYFDVKIPFGIGRYGGSTMSETDIKCVIVTANDKSKAVSPSSGAGDDVGPTDAASQAEKVAQ
jgi:hypothetical protein